MLQSPTRAQPRGRLGDSFNLICDTLEDTLDEFVADKVHLHRIGEIVSNLENGRGLYEGDGNRNVNINVNSTVVNCRKGRPNHDKDKHGADVQVGGNSGKRGDHQINTCVRYQSTDMCPITGTWRHKTDEARGFVLHEHTLHRQFYDLCALTLFIRSQNRRSSTKRDWFGRVISPEDVHTVQRFRKGRLAL